MASVRSSRSRTLDDATAIGMPRAVSSRTAVIASSNGSSRVSMSANSSPDSTGQTVCASGSGARCDRYACVCANERPTQAARSSAVTS